MRMRSLLIPVLCGTVWLSVTAGLSWMAFTQRDAVKGMGQDTRNYVVSRVDRVSAKTGAMFQSGQENITAFGNFIDGSVDLAIHETTDFFSEKTNAVRSSIESLLGLEQSKPKEYAETLPRGFIRASYDYMPPPKTLSEIKKRKDEEAQARLYAQITPAAAPAAPVWAPDQPDLEVEAVLVPRRITVISSSQDGRIADVPVGHGDSFKKGDLLIAYDCSNLRAEADIAKIERSFTEKRRKSSDDLFKLDIISDIDRSGAQLEDQKAIVKDTLFQERLKDCDIRAEFDGRVTNRLANPGEYTRTDRVLLEVASNEMLQAEFLVPSKWLRWINIDAPVSITVGETEKTYSARVARIHGEVDPVSQSIQMIATLDPYQDPLLPGMSGKATINVDTIRNAGIHGYLEVSASPDKR